MSKPFQGFIYRDPKISLIIEEMSNLNPIKMPMLGVWVHNALMMIMKTSMP